MLKTIFLIPFIFLVVFQLHAQDSTIPAEVIEVQSFGGWETENQTGFYRIVTKQFGYEHVVANIFIEWIAVSKKGNSVVKSVPVKEINGPNAYAVSIQKIEGEEILFDLTDVYTLTESTLKIVLGLPGKYKVAV